MNTVRNIQCMSFILLIKVTTVDGPDNKGIAKCKHGGNLVPTIRKKKCWLSKLADVLHISRLHVIPYCKNPTDKSLIDTFAHDLLHNF